MALRTIGGAGKRVWLHGMPLLERADCISFQLPSSLVCSMKLAMVEVFPP